MNTVTKEQYESWRAIDQDPGAHLYAPGERYEQFCALVDRLKQEGISVWISQFPAGVMFDDGTRQPYAIKTRALYHEGPDAVPAILEAVAGIKKHISEQSEDQYLIIHDLVKVRAQRVDGSICVGWKVRYDIQPKQS